MLLRQLYEAEGKVASFALGRLNPATNGHALLVDAIKKAPGDSFLFLTDRASKLPTDPLSPDEKLDWARKSFDGVSIGLAKTVLTAADRLFKMGYTEVTFLEGEPKLLKILQQYNGVEKELHNYNFDKINYVQLNRDPDAEGATGMSASKMRQTVVDNDLESFKKGVTQKALPHAEEMFKRLQGIMGVDAVEEDNIAELELFKKTDHSSIKAQDPNKLKVLDWVASRADGKEHFLSFYRKGAAWSGKLIFIRPAEAQKFMNKVEQNDDYLPQIKQALTNIATAGKLFDRLGIRYQIRRAD
jgi:hypothetical protein